jgi:uncharacterized protein (TIGR00299 family) protein
LSKLLFVDCFSGASGDMLLGALIDAGLPLDALRAAIGSLAVDGVVLRTDRVRRGGIAATKFSVGTPDSELPPADPAAAEPGDATHRHEAVRQHAHPHVAPSEQRPADRASPRGHKHRHLPQILQLIDRSALSASAKAKAAGLFQRLAEAEAAVHGIAADRVHFHEVGAIDSIVDIVGTVFGFEWFGADRIVASPLNTGSGTVECEHGVMPVPAPATARLVAGIPVFAAGPAVELLTPTGALLVTGYAAAYGPLPAMRIDRIGYGAGTRDFSGWPNLVRVIVGTPATLTAVSADRGGAASESLTVLECEVDDLNPQVLGTLIPRLIAAGARDAYYTPVQMKKNRPGTLITVLVDPTGADALLEVLFSETTTLGVRRQEVVREVLDREHRTVDTPYGPVRVKLGWRRGRLVNVAPEFDECARVAAERHVPIKEVLGAAMHAWRQAAEPRSPSDA